MPAAVSRLTVAIRDHSSWSSHQESSEAGGHGCPARSTSRGRPRFPATGRVLRYRLPSLAPLAVEAGVGWTRVRGVVARSNEAYVSLRTSLLRSDAVRTCVAAC